MKTNTDKYMASHGEQPKGIGFWAFLITGTDGRGRYTSQELQAYGNLTDAKNKAARDFKYGYSGIRRITEIIVLP